jgi:hypothetical protein
MPASAFVRSLPAFAGDAPLLSRIHGRKTTQALAGWARLTILVASLTAFAACFCLLRRGTSALILSVHGHNLVV